MPARDVLKNINLFVDGRGYAGQLQEYTPPALTLATEEARLGGMDAPVAIEMGQEAINASFVLLAYASEVRTQWGIAQGAAVQLTARGVLESWDGTVKAVVHRLRGKITSLDSGTWAPGQVAPMTATLSLVYFREEIDRRLVTEIDVENMVRMIDGVDRLAEQRRALGI